MAKELKVTAALSFKNGNVVLNTEALSAEITVAGTKCISNTASIGTSDETLALGDVSSIGWVRIENINETDTGHLLVGADGTNYPIKIGFGEFASFRFNGAAVHIKAVTAAQEIQYEIISA